LEQNLNTPQLPLSAGKRARASAGAANIAAKAHKGAGTTRKKQWRARAFADWWSFAINVRDAVRPMNMLK
jgi:hypothetical protein